MSDLLLGYFTYAVGYSKANFAEHLYRRSSQNFPSETVRKVSDTPAACPCRPQKSNFSVHFTHCLLPNLRSERCSHPFSDSLSRHLVNKGEKKGSLVGCERSPE